jgi:hypothetical protein
MKKLAIITAIVLTTGVTAFSLTKKETKADIKIEKASNEAVNKTITTLATAD